MRKHERLLDFFNVFIYAFIFTIFDCLLFFPKFLSRFFVVSSFSNSIFVCSALSSQGHRAEHVIKIHSNAWKDFFFFNHKSIMQLLITQVYIKLQNSIQYKYYDSHNK